MSLLKLLCKIGRADFTEASDRTGKLFSESEVVSSTKDSMDTETCGVTLRFDSGLTSEWGRGIKCLHFSPGLAFS